jgi:hypothetical protein
MGPRRLRADGRWGCRSPRTYAQATVQPRAGGPEVLVVGLEHMNRAMHDDVVAVELLPEHQWRRPSTTARTDDDADAGPNGDDGDDAIVPDAGVGLAAALDAPLEVRVSDPGDAGLGIAHS